MKQHIDQLRLKESNTEVTTAPAVTQEDSNVLDNHQYPSPGNDILPQDTQSSPESERRYSQHVRHPPDRFVPNSDGQ